VKEWYSRAEPKWTQSGKHQNHDFYNYCQDVSALYLHLWLEHAGNPNLTAYAKEGSEIPGGYDAGNTKSSAPERAGSTPSNSSSSSVDSKNGDKSDKSNSLSKALNLFSESSESTKAMKESGNAYYATLKRKVDEDTIASLLKSIDALENKLEDMFDFTGVKYIRKSKELKRLLAQYEKLTA
jgi:hypothetical protein